MAPIMRSAPGERVEIAGMYGLVGHYGEATGIAPKWLDKGDQFPLLGVSSEAGPLWYVRQYDAAEISKAA